MLEGKIKPGVIVSGLLIPEPIEVLAVIPMGSSLKVIGRGTKTGLTHDPIFSMEQLARLTVSAEHEPFDGDAALFRLGVEAHRLGLAYEYDPYFSLSIRHYRKPLLTPDGSCVNLASNPTLSLFINHLILS